MAPVTLGSPTVWAPDGDARYTGAASVVPLRGRGVVAFDPYESRLVFFSRDGQIDGTFGRKGSGPGEFSGIATLLPHPLGVAATDLRNRRFTLISEGREPMGEVPLPADIFAATAGSAGDGGAVLLNIAGESRIVWTDQLDPASTHWRDLDLDSVAAGMERGERGRPLPLVTGAPDGLGLIIGWPDGEYRLRDLGPDGAPRGEYRRALIERRDRTDAELDSLFAPARRTFPPNMVSAIDPEDYRLATFFESGLRDPCGRLWLLVDRDAPEVVGRRFDLFGPDRDFVGEVFLPGTGSVNAIDGDRLWGTVPDASTAVPAVAWWQLPRELQCR